MSDSRFDHAYDPVATPNPAYDDDFEPSPAPASSWDNRSLAQTLLHRARARQEAIADAFVDALLDGKLAFFRILLELEQAALTAEAEAEDARRPGLAEILLPMLQRERAEAAAHAARNEAQNEPAPESSRQFPSLNAPAATESANPPQPGSTDIEATGDTAAADPYPCRSRTVAHNRRRAKTRYPVPRHSGWKGSSRVLRPIDPQSARQPLTARYRSLHGDGIPAIPLTILSLTAVADPEACSEIRTPIRFQSYGYRHPRRRISRCNSFK